MSEWKPYVIGQVANVKGGKRLPKGELLVSDETPHPYIRVTDMTKKWIDKNGVLYVTPEIQKHISRYIVSAGDVILSIVGSIGFTARISNELHKANLTENCVRFELNTDLIIPEYLYYFFKSRIGQDEIHKRTVGSTQPKLPLYNIKQIEINLPSIKEQGEIANILTSLDNKIDLLHRQNETLEALGVTLFKHQITNADFVENDTLGNLFDVGIGRTPPRKEPHWFSFNPTDIKWISIKDMGNSGVYIDATSEYLTKDAVQRFNVPVIPAHTVLLSFKLTLGRVAITTEPMLSNEAIAHLKIKDGSKLYPEFIYLFLKAFNYSSLGSTSSIAEAINSQMIKQIEMPVPDDETLSSFKEQVCPLFVKMKSNSEQIKTLTQLRDTLLPKLMSGEVRIEGK